MSRLLLSLITISLIIVASHDVEQALSGQAPPQTTPLPVHTVAYIVQPGDTLFAISLRHRISVQELMTLNRLSRPVIYAGQTLNVPELTDQLGLPLTAQVLDIGGQMQALPLDCETRSAVDWAAFFGVSIDEFTFLSQLPLSDNPEKGFVGSVYGWWGQVPPHDYGVHAGPIAALLRTYQLPAAARRATDWNVVRAEIAANHPVMVWVTGHVENYGAGQSYTASDGQTTLVAPYEHTVMVIGYTPDSAIILDGETIYSRPIDQFMASWGALGKLAVLHN